MAIASPTRAYIKVFLALATALLSPEEIMYLKPAIITMMTEILPTKKDIIFTTSLAIFVKVFVVAFLEQLIAVTLFKPPQTSCLNVEAVERLLIGAKVGEVVGLSAATVARLNILKSVVIEINSLMYFIFKIPI